MLRYLGFAVLIVLPAIAQNETVSLTSHHQALQPLPVTAKLDQKAVSLGRKLFHESRMSGNGSISCASCHIISIGGVDRLPVSRTSTNELRDINTPTVYNAVHNVTFTFTRSIRSIKKFFEFDLMGRKALNNTWSKLLQTLENDDEYPGLFGQIYANGITKDNVLDALISYQLSLVTPDSRFDQYLRGDEDALSIKEKRGLRLFQDYGCIACHQGKNIGGNLFQKLGLFGDYFNDDGRSPKPVDYGRYNVTGDEQDRYYFRVPSLRNIALTAPYLHDGSIETLGEVIEVMGRYQLGRDINQADRNDIEAFLRSLTGQHPELATNE